MGAVLQCCGGPEEDIIYDRMDTSRSVRSTRNSFFENMKVHSQTTDDDR